MHMMQTAPAAATHSTRIEARQTQGARFKISRDDRGGWLVVDRLGRVGGIFVSEAAARHYAFEESGGHDGETCDSAVASSRHSA